MRSFILSLFLLIITPLLTAADLYTKVDSKNLVTGEQGQLTFVFFDRDIDSILPDIHAKGLRIQLQNQYPGRYNGRRVFVYVYQFVGVNPGQYTIPPISFNYYGQTLKSEPVEINIVDRSLLQKGEHNAHGNKITYYSHLFKSKSTLFPGETTELEYKVYLPLNSRILQWGLPTPQSADNCTAWRFDSPTETSTLGQATLDGKSYKIASYKTVLTALNPGKAVLGELESRIISAATVTDPRRGFSTIRDDIVLKHPATIFKVLPYPVQPPKNFKGAVGHFQMETQSTAKEKIKASDSINTSIKITGTGNLPNLEPPVLLDDDWEIIDTSRTKQGEERKSLSGNVEFNFIIKPTATTTTTPRFDFTYFDPEEKQFKTLVSPNLPIEVEGVSSFATIEGNSNQTKDTPQENMKDILGPIEQPSHNGRALITRLPDWTIHVIPVCLLLWLLGGSAFKFYQQKKINNASSSLRKQTLSKLAASEGGFLKKVGAYIERWHPNTQSEEVIQILQERDKLCYLPSEKHGVSKERKKEILAILKKLTLVIFMLGLAIPSTAEANEAAYKAWVKKDYSSALALYESDLSKHPDSADLEYNIANCYFRLNKPGEAALHYYRALEIDPFHVEARKNLGFLHSTQASILPTQSEDTDKWITWLTPRSYKDIAYLAGWFFLLSTLTILLKKPRGFSFASALTFQIISPLILATALVLYYNHPDRKPSSETTEGVILTAVPLYTEPYEPLPDDLSSKTLIQATPASPCRIIARRGDWTYIELGNNTRGWLPSNKVEAIRTAM